MSGAKDGESPIMNVDDLLLMSYVDDELTPDRRAEVEAEIAHAPELTERVDALRASVLPYRAAFERQPLPPLPDALASRIAELVSVSTAAPQPARAVQRRLSPLWLSAAFFAGAMSTGVLFSALSGLPPFKAGTTAEAAPWIKAVAEYQSMYVRETVASLREDRGSAAQQLAEVRSRDGMNVEIPDLSSAGLSFKRLQRLSFHGKPLLQIVYLPERGDPVALCVLPDARGDVPLHAQRVGDMDTVAWRRSHLSYVLLARQAPVDLQQIGRRIADGNAAPLFSEDGAGAGEQLS